ncbi:uncharacterized protein LOC121900782 [Thunnus maccoyii]|uniref:uncharacterized protein LOC121900782 n=1 Tax=Thunnus maccoyii TaxID=8240 RepID=UPI001C4BFEBB|nr:uncharacterized protein LOC121900782 [Thunnus maccoyii]
MAKLLYVHSKREDDSRLILTERSPIILHLGAKLRAARLDGDLDLCPPDSVPHSEDFLWESSLFNDSSDPTGLRLILKGISGPRSAQEAASSPSLPQQAPCCEPCTVDKASPGLNDSPVQTENKTSTQNWDHLYCEFVDPDTLLNQKRELGNITPDTASCSYKRPASEMDNDEFGSPSKSSFTLSSSSSPCYTDEELEREE